MHFPCLMTPEGVPQCLTPTGHPISVKGPIVRQFAFHWAVPEAAKMQIPGEFQSNLEIPYPDLSGYIYKYVVVINYKTIRKPLPVPSPSMPATITPWFFIGGPRTPASTLTLAKLPQNRKSRLGKVRRVGTRFHLKP